MHTKTSILLICCLFVAVLLGFGAWLVFGNSTNAQYAVIHAGDGATQTLNLSRDTELVIQTDLGSNTVQVQDGRVRVCAADCPHQDCVERGWIESPNEQIVCLPHKLWIEISSSKQGNSNEPDVMSQ